MGNGNVKFKDELAVLNSCDTKTARLLLDRYLALDMEFCFTAADLQRLFRECELGYGEDVVSTVMDAFPMLNENAIKTINALDFIEGFTVLSKGSFEDKVDLIFDIFDFQKRGEITFDEMTIMLICTAQGVRHLSGFGSEPDIASDDKVTEMIRTDFGMEADEAPKDIPKDHFVAWAKEKASRLASMDQILRFLQGNSSTIKELVVEAKPETDIDAKEKVIMKEAPSVAEEITPVCVEEDAPAAEEEASAAAEEEASGAVEEEASGAVEEEASGAVEEEASGAVEEEASGAVEEEASGAVEEEASGAVEDEASGAVEDEASSAVEEEASGAVEDEASGAVEDEASSAVEEEASDAIVDEASDAIVDEALGAVEDEALGAVEDKALAAAEWGAYAATTT